MALRTSNPSVLRPVLLLRIPEPFDHPDWPYEVKFDGFRRDWPHSLAFDALFIDGEDSRELPSLTVNTDSPRFMRGWSHG